MSCPFRFPPLGLGSNATSSVRPSLTTLVKSVLLPLPALFSSSLVVYHVHHFLRILFVPSPQWKLHEGRDCYALCTAVLEQCLGNKYMLKQ